MDDLISRAAAIEICKSIVPNTNPDFYNLRSKAGYGSWMHSNGEVCAITNIETKIEALPAVDAAPVVHAQPVWINPLDPKAKICMWKCSSLCSVCGDYVAVGWKYCPDCGAMMDGWKEG